MEGVGEEFCCNSQYRYMLIHHLHKKLKSIWACCAAAPTGSTSALVASHGCSTRGPAATHVEVLSSSILQVCETLLWTMWCGTNIWIPFVQFRCICACGLQSVCHKCMHISRQHTETRQTQPTSPLSVPKPNTSIHTEGSLQSSPFWRSLTLAAAHPEGGLKRCRLANSVKTLTVVHFLDDPESRS